MISNRQKSLVTIFQKDAIKVFFVATAFISPCNTQTMPIKSFYTQQHCYDYLKTLYPGGIRTRAFSFLRRMRIQDQSLLLRVGKQTMYVPTHVQQIFVPK
jgi:hypothetical protein